MKDYRVKYKIISLLTAKEFVSGEKVGEHLGISRAAVSKHIKGLQEWGLDIYSVQGKGYKLANPVQLLDEQIIQSQTSVPVELISIIDSTNQYLLDNANSLAQGAVCLAEYQAKGRGRRGRQWVSPFGSNLYFSMYWQLEAGMAAAMGLSLVIGIAAVEALEQLGISGVKLKWPNDLYYKDRKLAGILVEMSGQAGGAANLVIGMGININMPQDISGITQPWVSVSDITDGNVPDRNQLAVNFINSWEKALSDYETSGMPGFVERWNKLDNFLGRPVKLIIGPREVCGIARGINEQGGVLLETDKGIETFIGGEISLRPDE
ncbi:biotin--[acetyl-CoA-carboxylase] synthetase [Vibrio albus]|uniref:Bifunctional ligase/repressor BirA n=1 Tax=Vibrio albus TaxID=2200953 RepID=A0A2U3BAI2_9VIBR|nr:bifunctional biotin--[acetyl-CoA-carboxylase] ligase/biotin operon repressor BirA [Vibrio albus]PWI33773.1 biotin--[acetyl-CoA-carboxylase] synthetase [Vibrio albus]